MKHILRLLAAFLLCISLFACKEDTGDDISINGNLTPASPLEPADEIPLDLDTFSDTDTLWFRWNKAEWDGLGWPTYSLAIYKEQETGGNPVYSRHVAQLDSTRMYLKKDELKNIFNTVAGGEKISSVDVFWSIRTSAKDTRAQESGRRKITLAMTPDPDAFVAGNDIILDGEGAGTEAGRKFVYIPNTTYSWNKSISAHYNDLAPLKEFDYEIFTSLEAGKPIVIWSGTSTGDRDWIFVPDNDSAESAGSYSLRTVKEAAFRTCVSTSGTYRIRLNSQSKAIYIKKINEIKLRFWAPVNDNPMTYQGNGTWYVDLAIPSACKGYKFLFFGLDGDQPTGAQYPSETVPSGTVPEMNPADRYWNIVPVQGGPANGNKENGTFRVLDDAKGRVCRYTIYMNDTYGTYTHCVSEVPSN